MTCYIIVNYISFDGRGAPVTQRRKADRLYRSDCEQVIRDAGLPAPPKSACWYCPFMKVGEWKKMRYERPDLFARAMKFEENGNRFPEFVLHGSGKPLRVLNEKQLGEMDQFLAQDTCDEGVCFV